MDIYLKKSREFFDRADYLYSKFCSIPHFNDTENILCLDNDDYNNIRTLNSSMHGLICEYYLKGILLPLLDLVFPYMEEYKTVKPILDSLSEQEKYNLIIGNSNEIINRLSTENGIKKSLLKFLKENSIASNKHNLAKIFNQIKDNYSLIMNDVKKELSRINDELEQMTDEELDTEDEFYDHYLGKLLHIENYLESLNQLPDILCYFINYWLKYNNSDKDYKIYDDLFNFDYALELLESTDVNNAFPEARYGNLKADYDINSDLLFSVTEALCIASRYSDKCVMLSNNQYMKRIYPDKNSKIYILKNNQIDRIYTYQYSFDYFDKTFRKDKFEQIFIVYGNRLSCVPEYGFDKIIELLPNNEYSLYNFFSDNVSIDNDVTVCFYQDNDFKVLSRFFTYDLNKNNLDVKNIIDDFEKNLKDNDIYNEDQERIKNFVSKQLEGTKRVLKK